MDTSKQVHAVVVTSMADGAFMAVSSKNFRS